MEGERNSIETLSGGRYRMIRELGGGSTARVYLAEDTSDGSRWAAKHFRLATAPSWKEWELFERGAAVLRGLEHPGIPQFREMIGGSEQGGHEIWLIESFVPGRSLEELIEAHGRARPASAVRVAMAMCSILEYLHARTPPVVHRDIKPSNAIIRPDGTLVLVDFGSVQEGIRRGTLGGTTVTGTYGFMPPEQFMGRAEPASDLYAVGAVLLQLVTGRPPSDFPVRGLRIRFEEDLEDLPAVSRVLDRLLEPRVEARVGNAGEARALLDSARRHLEGSGPLPELDGLPRPGGDGVQLLERGGGGRCPGCEQRMDLVHFESGDVEVDLCPSCKGMWLDLGELDHLVVRPLITRPDMAAISREVATMRAIPQAVVYRKCPRCEAIMHRANFGEVSGIIVDECRQHGLFLDEGELEAIRRFVAAGGMEVAEQRKGQRAREEARLQAQNAASDRRLNMFMTRPIWFIP